MNTTPTRPACCRARSTRRAILAALALSFALSPLAAAQESFGLEEDVNEPAGSPLVEVETPAAVEGVLYARAFTLREPVAYRWSAEVEAITEGTILVLEVDPAYLRHRALAEPVLYVGDKPAWRVSHGSASGRLVAIVPGEVDLTTAPLFFGAPALPERIDAAKARAALESARAAGITPLEASTAEAARERGGEALELAGRLDLLLATEELIERYVTR